MDIPTSISRILYGYPKCSFATRSGVLFCMAKTITLGKIFEHQIITKLLKNGFEVFLPIVDDRGVDCIIKNNKGNFIEIQIKGRRKDSRNIFNIKPFKPRNNYFFIFIDKDEETFIIPSSFVNEWLGDKNKFNLTKSKKNHFVNNFDLLND